MPRLGRYEIIAELGRGAMGTVYRAHDPKIDRVVALKTITVTGITPADEAEFRQRFFREAQAAGKLSHSGIVTIHDVGEEEATHTPYIVMELIEGVTLEELGRGGERLPTQKTLELVEQVAEALDYAHSRQIVHRDIKPANIIVTADGRAKITDFGVAKLQTMQFTQPGQTLGTPAYMSPEQVTAGAVDGRSDLFSLGTVLYWLLTGEKPFPGETTTAVTFKIVFKDAIPPSELNPSLSADYDYVVARALAKDPARRYPRGQEFADDLEDLKNGRPPRSRVAVVPAAAPERTVVLQPSPAAPPPTAPVRTAPMHGAALRAAAAPSAPVVLAPPSRRRWLLPAGLAALLLLLLGSGWWWWSSSSKEEKEKPGTAQQATVGPSKPSPKKDERPPWAPATGARRQEAESETRTRAVASLRLRGEHNFDRATLYVYVDDQLLKQARLSGATAERKGVSVGMGRISQDIGVSPGRHTITIRIHAPRDDFDQTKYITGTFAAGQTRTLEISLGKLGKWIGIGELTRELTLRWAD